MLFRQRCGRNHAPAAADAAMRDAVRARLAKRSGIPSIGSCSGRLLCSIREKMRGDVPCGERKLPEERGHRAAWAARPEQGRCKLEKVRPAPTAGAGRRFFLREKPGKGPALCSAGTRKSRSVRRHFAGAWMRNGAHSPSSPVQKRAVPEGETSAQGMLTIVQAPSRRIRRR